MDLANARINKLFSSESGGNKYLIEDFTVNEGDANNAVTILANNIPPNSTVLDVGCAQGKFGEYLHDIKNCKMFGIEINEAALEYVRERGKYEALFHFNVEDRQATPEYLRFENSDLEFDFVIMSDVLEHLANPTKVLVKMSQKLKLGGKVLVSIPNIAHADISLNLLNGVFNYSDLGILDNTHLKFFTKHSFAQWIRQINEQKSAFCFDCSFLGGTFYYSDYLWSIKENCKPLFNIIEENPDFNVLQLLFMVTKLPVQAPTAALDGILSESTIDIVQSLNKALSSNQQSRTMYTGEREWYEGRVSLLNEQAAQLCDQKKELQQGIDWLKEQKSILERDMDWLKEQNSILERDTDWLKEQNNSLEQSMGQLQIQLEDKSRELDIMSNTLSQRIIRRITKISSR